MYFFPKAKLTLHSKHSPEIFLQKLRQDMEAPRGFRFFSQDNLSFEGMVAGDQFRIKRITQIGLGGFATCDGWVDAAADGNGSTIELTFSIRISQIISIFLFAGYIAWQRREALGDPARRSGAILIIGFAFAMMLIASMVRFNLEVQRTAYIMEAM